MNRFFMLLALILLIVVLLNGCNSSIDNFGGSNRSLSNEEGDLNSVSDSETPEITLRLWFGREDFIPADRFETFHAQHPNIRVEFDVIPLEQSVTDFTKNYNTDDAPDVFQTYHENVPMLATQGLLYDMTDQFKKWQQEKPDTYNNLLPQAFDITSNKGKRHGLAIHLGPRWNVYRSDWFQQAGLSIPETWDDVLDAARKLQQEGYLEENQYAYALVVGATNSPNWFQSQFQAMGGQYTKSGMPIINSKAGIYLINFYQTLVREKLVHPETLAWHSGKMRAAFFEGNAAMATIGENIFPVIQNELGPYGEKWIASQQPYRPGAQDEARSNASSWVMMVSAKTGHPEAVSLVLQYLSDTEIVREVAHRYQPTMNITVMTEPEYYEAKPWQAELREQFNKAEFIPGHIKHPTVQRVLVDLMQEAVANPNTPAETIAMKYQDQLDDLDR